jgi:hypothetical protein
MADTFGEQLRRVDALQLWDFRVSRTAGTVLILGSRNFTYYHQAEIEFRGVTHCDLPETFSHATFTPGDDSEGISVFITAEPFPLDNAMHDYEVRAAEVEVRIGTVYYYDRPDLGPGETIAPWVHRGKP